MENIFVRWWRKQKAHAALDEVQSLERNRKFINPFFLGQTKYEIERDKSHEKLKVAREKYESLKQYL